MMMMIKIMNLIN